MSTRLAVVATFFLNGFAFASWASRIPDVRATLALSAPLLGLLLLAMSVGSVGTLASSGWLIHRFGTRRVVVSSALLLGCSLAIVAVGVSLAHSVLLTALALCGYGIATAAWDVAMNVEGAEVERISARPIMSWLHAAFSFGTVAGAAVAVVGARASASLLPHLIPVAVLVAGAAGFSARRYSAVRAPANAPSGVGRA